MFTQHQKDALYFLQSLPNARIVTVTEQWTYTPGRMQPALITTIVGGSDMQVEKCEHCDTMSFHYLDVRLRWKSGKFAYAEITDDRGRDRRAPRSLTATRDRVKRIMDRWVAKEDAA